MSYSYTYSETTTFTITHARHLAAKVATDLKRIQRFYGEPPDVRIAGFEEELIQFLKAGYLDTVTYGFQRHNRWITPTLRYTAQDLLGAVASDDDPGRIRPGADISGASFYSYLTQNAAWDLLTLSEKEAFNQTLPFRREGAPAPGVSGYFSNDLSYSAGGRALNRSVARSY